MRVGVLRERLAAALVGGLRRSEIESIALTADRSKAIGVAIAGLADDAEVRLDRLQVTTRAAGIILGFHPEHVRRLIRRGRLQAHLEGGDYRIALDALWPILESRYRAPGRRRARP